MFVRILPALVALMLCVAALGAEDRPVITVQTDSDVNPWTHLDFRHDPDAFQFIVVGDRTGGEREGVFMEAMRKINLLQPEFVMSVGDLIEGYNEDPAELDRQWDELIGFVNHLEMPFFYVPGNHDISNPVQAKKWRERFGRAYYHFVYKNVLFLCVNSEDPPASHISDEQVEYFRKALEENPQVRWTLAFLHKPLWAEDPVKTNWGKFEALLADRPHTVFAGHWHNYLKFERNSRSYIVLATIGGGSTMRGIHYGEFDHIAWVTMTERGPLVANLMLDGIWSENIRTETLAKSLQPLLEGAAVRSEPLAVDPQSAEPAKARLRLTNPTDVPMRVHLAMQPGSEWDVTPMNVEKEVTPNSVEHVDVELKRTGQAGSGFLPVPVAWTVAFTPNGGEPVEVKGAHRIIAETPLEVERRSEPVTVDGDLSEWAELPIDVREPGQVLVAWESWHGPADCSYRFGVGYDDQYLYVAARTIDDKRVALPARQARRQDGVEIVLDPRPADARRRGANDAVIAIPMSPGESAAGTIFARDYKLPEGVQAVCVATPEGHAAEVAIPLRYLTEAQGGDWRDFRLNIGVYDNDGHPNDAHAHLWWRPRWNTPANYADSGTFARK